MREENKTYSKHRKKNDCLLSGHLKCACNLTWRAANCCFWRQINVAGRAQSLQ
ncbi:MAG: hypothetical protein ISR59_13145 [Anaerolineales bacterium]|nr:hypothetical protein [Anaerolineales bacterium]